MTSIPRDSNRITTVAGASSTDGVTPVPVYADPTTHRMLVDTSGSSSSAFSPFYSVGPASSNATYITDGTADEVQINQAITAANAAGGGTVYIVKGTYNCAASVLMLDNVILEGDGIGTIISFTVHATSLRAFGRINWKIRNLKIDTSGMAGQAGVTDLEQCVYPINCQNWEMHSCYLDAYAFGLYITAQTNAGWTTQNNQKGWFHHNYIYGHARNDLVGGGPALSTDPDVTDIIIEANHIVQDFGAPNAGTYINALDLVKAKKITVIGNILEGSLLFGSEQDPHELSTIIGNNVRQARGSTVAGIIRVEDDSQTNSVTNHVLVEGNIVYGGYIQIDGKSGQRASGCSVIGNTIKNITGTTDTATKPQHGIWLRQADNCTVEGNYVDANGVTSTTGILLENSSTNYIGPNTINGYTTGIEESGTYTANDFFGLKFISCTANVGTNLLADTAASLVKLDGSGIVKVQGNLSVSDEAYGGTWDGSVNVPTKNAVYDKIQSLVLGTGTVTTVSVATANGFSGTVANATTTPAITIIAGAITPTSVNGLTITANGTNTLNIAAGKTFAVNQTITLAGTDSQTYTFPTTSATIARTDAAQTFTGIQTIASILGGTGTTSTLTLQTTSGVGASGADMIFKVGNAGGTEAMRILNSGSIGIGETAPDNKLQITSTSSGALVNLIKIKNNATATSTAAGIAFATTTSSVVSSQIHSLRDGSGNNDLVFSNNLSSSLVEVMRITSAGALKLISGGVIDFASANVVLTHTSGILTMGTGDLRITTAGTNTASVVTVGGTQTLTNKRVTKRTGTTTSSATPTINTDNVDFYSLTAQTADITSFTTNLSGTPTENQTLWIAITGTAARAITWGTSFEASTVALPTTTVTTARLDVGFVWNTVTSKWRCVAVC
jgi:parallel beta-helix repeat protein